MATTYDPKCYELAKAFLKVEGKIDNEQNIHELAIRIQDAIEDFFMDKMGRV